MLTEEIGLREHLEENDIKVTETDVGSDVSSLAKNHLTYRTGNTQTLPQ